MKISFTFSLSSENVDGWGNQPFEPDNVSINALDSKGKGEGFDSSKNDNVLTSLISAYKQAFAAKREQIFAGADLLQAEVGLSVRAALLFALTSLAAVGVVLFVWLLINSLFVTSLYIVGTPILLALGIALLINSLVALGLIKAAVHYKHFVSLPNTRHVISTFTKQSGATKE